MVPTASLLPVRSEVQHGVSSQLEGGVLGGDWTGGVRLLHGVVMHWRLNGALQLETKIVSTAHAHRPTSSAFLLMRRRRRSFIRDCLETVASRKMSEGVDLKSRKQREAEEYLARIKLKEIFGVSGNQCHHYQS